MTASLMAVPLMAVSHAYKCGGHGEPSRLLVVWTSGDREVALKMVYMYTFCAKEKGWWGQIRLLIWGPSSQLLAKDQELQDYLQKMKDAGVDIIACKACADMYGVTEKLQELGVNVFYVGSFFTDMLKSGWVTVTF
jgi:hypothetical protein